MNRLRVTAPAERDITRLLDHSEWRFGRAARRRYERLLMAALADITRDPDRIGSRTLPELGGARLFHMNRSRSPADADMRVGSARHVIFYKFVEPDQVVVLHVLHDAMDLPRHLRPDPFEP